MGYCLNLWGTEIEVIYPKHGRKLYMHHSQFDMEKKNESEI